MESFRLRNADSGLVFDLALADANVAIFASADRLTQAFENLIDNAIRFSPEGGRIMIALKADAESAEVTIADEGPGIPEEHRDRIFSRFFSYRPDDDAGSNHTGLGLALARSIVESHGGTITAEPRRGGGTRMVMVLPLAER